MKRLFLHRAAHKILHSYKKVQKCSHKQKGQKGAIFEPQKKSCIINGLSDTSIPTFSIEQSDPRIPSEQSTFSTGCADRIARSIFFFLKVIASLTTPQTHYHTVQQLRCWLDCYYDVLLLLLLLITAGQRGASCSPPASSTNRRSMAAVRVIDRLFSTPLLLLCSRFGDSRRSPAPQPRR